MTACTGSALESLHDALGQMGFERTSDLVCSHFLWPRMCLDVDEKIRTCEQCLRRKARVEKTVQLVNIKTSWPLELLCMDYLSLEPDGRGTKNNFATKKHFTKFAVAVSTPDQKDRTNFESTVIKDLCQILGIKKTHTTPIYPRGNPLEWFNHTL